MLQRKQPFYLTTKDASRLPKRLAFRREATGAVAFDSFAASAEKVDYGADGWEGVALGRGQADIECGFELVAELDQVKRVPSKVTDKGGVEAHLRRREVEVPCDDGLDACLNGSFHLPSSLTQKCQGNANEREKRATRPLLEEWS